MMILVFARVVLGEKLQALKLYFTAQRLSQEVGL